MAAIRGTLFLFDSMKDAKHLRVNLFLYTSISDIASMHRWLSIWSLARERHGSNIPHMQIRRMRLKYSRIPQAVWKDIVGKGSVIEKEDHLDNTAKDRQSYDHYFWEHILSPSDREFLAKHDIHCVEVLHESYSSWLAPKRGRSPEAIARDNAAFKIYQTLPDKIIEDGINKACDILTGREDSPHHLSPGTAKSKERKRIAKEKVETEHR